MIHVIVHMQIKEGHLEEFLAMARTLRAQVLREKGCLAYDYMRDLPTPQNPQAPIDPLRITLLERWESMAALEAHLASAHMKAAGPRMKDLRAGVTVQVVEPLF